MITKSPSQCDRGNLILSTPAEQEKLAHLRGLLENTRKRGTNTKGRSAARHRKRRRLKKARKAGKQITFSVR